MAKLTDMGGRPQSGIVPFAVVGIVTDNVDPDELGRIQVKFPTLHEEPLSFWLRQSAPMAGKERGFYALPEKEDEVIVIFMQGSQDVGVIVGQFWNGVDKPPKEAKDGLPGPDKTDTGGSLSTDKFTEGSKDLEKNDRRFWKSRSGHLFVFDDTEGKETVQIWDKDHTLALIFETKDKRIILSNSGGDIHIRAKNDIFIEAGKSIKWKAGENVEGESVKATTHKAGQNYDTDAKTTSTMKTGQGMTMDAGTDFTAKAAVNATLDGKASTSVKGGSSATLDGGSSARIVASMVTIN